ncbi:MAG TPA: PEP/pyruvate-binding domain-containing protein [Ignavibacteriaceae bacterium]|nr:PEP/pyruvate-binding domain-containing protein [Ignavibacteriaceae bacterium]HPO56158.1 PEP/pyruvate-binding domain-containing protein [Ignavibacteriaceae bacterium]
MDKKELLKKEDQFGKRINKFQKLMQYKVRDILLVSSMYDNYLFEEDGRLYELIREEYQVLNLSHAPEITAVTTAYDALELLAGERSFDLIITTLHIEDMHVLKFAQMIRETGINTPIILLAYDNLERKEIVTNYDTSIFDRIFIWQGDYKLLIGMVKYLEDKLNVEHDTKVAGVQSIILVEDNVKFYSSYLPLVYTEILKQSQRLISEGVNLTHRYLRMRARPKILLCTNYEEAWDCFEKYKDYILGIITDVNFSRNKVKDPEAGLKFAAAVKQEVTDIPILLQSSQAVYANKAKELGGSFVLKGSPRLLHELRDFMLSKFGFGDFIFQLSDGNVVGIASNLNQLEDELQRVPEESILYHSERNDFSRWLKARTEFWLAHKLRPRKVSDFNSVKELRNLLINSLREYKLLRQRGVVTDFIKESFDANNSFARIGGGTLGGKARGLGFTNHLLANFDIRDKIPGVEIFVPSAVVVATDVFDQFMEDNNLFNFAMNEPDDEKIIRRFLEAEYFPIEIIAKLKEFLEINHIPLAVRSSSLLEDSQFQPFAGVYQTYMIPNSNENIEIRLQELLNTIKCVYASTFFRSAKDYMKATNYRLEEEKMAVIIQRLIGAYHGRSFYPDFSGVAKSYNFYPVSPQKSSDGIVHVALGLGKIVVEGGNTVRFCPKYPKHLLQFFSTKETIKNAQQEFYALDPDESYDLNKHLTPDTLIKSYPLDKAEKDGTLFYSGSTYSSENDAVYDGLSREGRRVVTFAPILKQKVFPLPEVLDMLLDLGSWGMGTHIEMEFAVNMNVPHKEPKQFAILQMRPLVIGLESESISISDYEPEEVVCSSNQVLGNGARKDITDVVFVDINKYDRSKSKEVAAEVSRLNAKLVNEKKPYILMGVGRWGSFDPWLGIPVTWDQISGAGVIVESGFKDFIVSPSQGSHFFQNITSFRVGYFTVNSLAKSGTLDWDWLNKQTAYEELEYTKHLRFSSPLTVKINGRENLGVILKPE